MTWKTSPYYTLPAEPPVTSIVEWDLAQIVRSDTENAALKFLAASPEPQYANPGAYIDYMIAAAKKLAADASSSAAKFVSTAGYPYMPVGWDPIMSAIAFAEACFATLATIAVNLGDPNTASVYDAWVNHTGQYYGGHLPAAPVTTQSSGNNPGTGTTSATPSILGGTGASK